MAKQHEVINDPNYVPVLDHGFVGLVDIMGDDSSIVQAARVSYGKGTKKMSEDRHLIRYLLRHKHTTPFEMVEFKFHMKMPIFVARQWIRHRTASVNEYSGRYSEMPDEFYIPKIEQIAPQSKDNKQGRERNFIELSARAAAAIISATAASAYSNYQSLLGNKPTANLHFPAVEGGIARELARMVLPLNNYTEWYWKIDLKNLMHLLKLREDSHAQWEIQEFARAIHKLIEPHIPIAMEAFKDYWQEGIELSRMEVALLKEVLDKALYNVNTNEREEWLQEHLGKGRELQEFKNKFNL